MEDTVDSMRIGGFVMLGLAAAELIEKFVLSIWLDLDKSVGGTIGAVLFNVLLGVAMLQGSNGARKVVLWLTALSGVVLAVGMGGLFLAGFGHLWPLLATILVVCVGIFVLNFSAEQRRGVVIGALALIFVGWVGSVAASVFLAGSVDFATMKTIREWSSSDRSFENPEAGVSMKVPAQWVVLKEGNPMGGDEKPLLTLANTEVTAVANLHRETRTYSVADNLEFFLDGIAKSKATTNAGFTPMSRTDTTIGGFPARRMKASWTADGEDLAGTFTAWQDGHVFYYLAVTAPRVISKRLDQDVDTLERSVSFTGPWTTFLRDKVKPTRVECPLLSEAVILGLVGVVPKDAPPEAYCREAYRLAFTGQSMLDPAASQRLGASMKTFFGGLPKAKSGRFGPYVERLRSGQRTTLAEDKDMMQAARASMETLTPEVQEDIRANFALAVEMGRFSKIGSR